MTDLKEKSAELLRRMSPDDRGKALKTWLAIQNASSDKECEFIMEHIDPASPVAEFIAVMALSVVEHGQIKKEREKLSANAAVVRADALQILTALIAANPGSDDQELLWRAIELARKLHDTF